MCTYTQAIECRVHVFICISVCKNCKFEIIDFVRERIHFLNHLFLKNSLNSIEVRILLFEKFIFHKNCKKIY